MHSKSDSDYFGCRLADDNDAALSNPSKLPHVVVKEEELAHMSAVRVAATHGSDDVTCGASLLPHTPLVGVAMV